jgi:hypothetical protein
MDKNSPLVVESSWWSFKLWPTYGKGRGNTILTKEIKLEQCKNNNNSNPRKRIKSRPISTWNVKGATMQKKQCERNYNVRKTTW